MELMWWAPRMSMNGGASAEASHFSQNQREVGHPSHFFNNGYFVTNPCLAKTARHGHPHSFATTGRDTVCPAWEAFRG